MRAASILREQLGVNVNFRRLVASRDGGADNGPEWLVDAHDSADAIERQWHRLHAAFQAPTTVLLAHYFNHYAMIYAMREVRPTSSAARPRLELLTSKPGQRPCRRLTGTAWKGGPQGVRAPYGQNRRAALE